MSWLHPWQTVLVGLVMAVAGCDYRPSRPANLSTDLIAGPLPNQSSRPSRPAVIEDINSEKPAGLSAEVIDRRKVILDGVINLIRTADEHPGGRNFEIATESLNELFELGTPLSEYAHTAESRDFLLRKIYELTNQDPADPVKGLASRKFTIRDARHIEDCMLYRSVAVRVAGEGDDLTRVRRLFDWMVRSVLLVPAESLSGSGVRQAQVRPADVLVRGMATENGVWSERGWLFMALCRQIGVDVGILTYSQRRPMLMVPGTNANPPILPWITAAIIDDKPYLFDMRIGLEVPSVDGKSVATLNEVIAHPEILERLELPGGQLEATVADLTGSPSRIGVLIDSSVGYLCPRMRLLQGELRGEYRTILFRDPAEQAKHFARALGPRFGGVFLWNLPIQVEELLFSDPNFVAATQASLRFFDPKFPLARARIAQLRGKMDEAIAGYRSLRFAEKPETADGKPIGPETQKALDIYASYFLAQIQLDLGHLPAAEDLFRKMLNLVPEPGPGRYFYYMLRWGALNNLARICEARGDATAATAYYIDGNSTNGLFSPEYHGNLVRARRLVFENPLTPPAPPLPAAPADQAPPQATAAQPPTSQPAPPPLIAAPNP